MSFPCTSCGACCKNVGHLGLPLKSGTTICAHLSDDNKCAIYGTRPLICRIDAIYEIVGGDRAEFYKLTADACGKLIEKEGMDISFVPNL